MVNSTVKRILGQTSRVGSFLPLIWFIGVLAFYVRAKMHLGYWPKAYIPDPKSLPFEFHHGVFMIAVFPLFWSIFALPIVWMARFRASELEFKKEAMPFFLGWALIGCVVALPGIDFITWFLD